MITVRKANERGKASFGWLNSRHTFSFGHYYDPEQMGFSALRVINDDTVQPGKGFDTHGHRDMEIISYVLNGTIEHQDSTGNVERLPAGEFQLMSAGRGIYHSEYNASDKEPLHFLQIWIQPDRFGEAPGYQQKDFGLNEGLTPIATPTGEDGTLKIKQDASLYQLILAPGEELTYPVSGSRRVYVHQVDGQLNTDNALLEAGDGARIEHSNAVLFTNHGDESARALVFDLP